MTSKKRKLKKRLILYGSISLLFLVWMTYFDDHSLLIHRELRGEVSRLQKEKKLLTTQIDKVQQQIIVLKNPDSLQKYAREEYYYKADDEVIFIIDSNAINAMEN